MDGRGGSGGHGHFLTGLIRGSIIFGSLDRFTVWVYDLLKNGFFGWIFTGYDPQPVSRILPKIAGSRTALHLRELRFGICRRIESSVIVNGCRNLMRYLLACRLKVFGTFFLSFTVYSAVQKLIFAGLDGKLDKVLENRSALVFYAAGLAVFPLILSKKSLAEGIADSAVGRLLLRITAYRPEDLSPAGDGGHLNAAFLFGILFGFLTYWIGFPYILAGFAGLCAAALILIRPELGVMALFFGMPWLPTMALAVLVIYTFLCLLLKLFRRKRILRLEPVDIFAAAYAVLVFFGGVVSLSAKSLEPALLMVCFMMGYFLTVVLMRSREWLARCVGAAVLSGGLLALYGIYLYFVGGGYSSQAWLDSEMFGNIENRAVATLDNPNMLGEYLILVIPVAVAMIVGKGEGLGRLPAFFSAAAMSVCLVLTWSRGAWLGLIAGLLVFLFMWHRRSVWLIVAGFASLPFLPAVLPASIVQRITSIGNMGDSSTSYRVNIWRAAVQMIRDNFFTGIGIGEGAWFRVYPLYAYQGVETAPHTHNLFMQIWLEMGLGGILVFLVFLFLLFQSAFTVFRDLAGDRPLLNPDISPAPLQPGFSGGAVKKESRPRQERMRQGKNQLRISAAGPLCGIAAVLVQGLTDYAWYNYRLFLMFWLMAGLCSCFVRNGREQLDSTVFEDMPDASERVFPLADPKKRARKTAGPGPQMSPAKTEGE